MKKLQYTDFQQNDAWVILRLDTQVNAQPIDIYLAVDLPSGVILASSTGESDVLTQANVKKFFQDARNKKGLWPKRIILGKADPFEVLFSSISKELNLEIEIIPTSYLQDLEAPIKVSFGKQFYSPSSISYAGLKDDASLADREAAKSFIPDSYDPCSCGSNSKFKFCCKPILREIMAAMAAAERGKKTEALDWIAKAKEVVGETAEVLCREAIVYSFFDKKKSHALLKKCLKVNPNHPRANYIAGIAQKELGHLHEAIQAYKRAIEYYPKTDRYHLNETWNNLGTTYFELGDYKEAKTSWEQALVLLPSDIMVRQNLVEYIYTNPAVPVELRKPSPFVERFYQKR